MEAAMGEYGAPYPQLGSGLESQPAQVIPAHQLQQVTQRQVLSRDPGHRLLAVQAQVTEPGHQVRVRGPATVKVQGETDVEVEGQVQ